jgi:hypothetical protein
MVAIPLNTLRVYLTENSDIVISDAFQAFHEGKHSSKYLGGWRGQVACMGGEGQQPIPSPTMDTSLDAISPLLFPLSELGESRMLDCTVVAICDAVGSAYALKWSGQVGELVTGTIG